MLLSHHCELTNVSNLIFTTKHFHHRLIISDSTTLKFSSAPIPTKTLHILSHDSFPFTTCRAQSPKAPSISADHSFCNASKDKKHGDDKSFWAGVSLIIGTAVGPGMLGLPAATIKSGPFPSTIAILLSWVYVISSILLVAELSFASMEEDGVEEVSFTSLATKTLGGFVGAFVAVIYACLSFSLVIACVSGLGSIMIQWFPSINSIIAHACFPLFFGILIALFPFKVIDSTNRLLCFIMLFSISALVATGLSVGSSSLFSSFTYASWGLSAILPAIPVTVLTLGFHVITPFVCKIAGKTVLEATNAILFGGSIPLIMVLSWNLVVLGLARTNVGAPPSQDPISLLLSVNASALPAVQGFAFSALATSLIGYAVSFPKQLLDTLELFQRECNMKKMKFFPMGYRNEGGVGFATYSRKQYLGNAGQVFFDRSNFVSVSGDVQTSNVVNNFVMVTVLGAPIVIAVLFPSTFAKALDFAGVYANCFLFGILPPIMAWIYRSRKTNRSSAAKYVSILPGGQISLLLLFVIALILAIWH